MSWKSGTYECLDVKRSPGVERLVDLDNQLLLVMVSPGVRAVPGGLLPDIAKVLSIVRSQLEIPFDAEEWC